MFRSARHLLPALTPRQGLTLSPVLSMRCSIPMAPIEGTYATATGTGLSGEVVEIGLLLPASWATGLQQMSQRRGQSMGQLLRDLIDRALVDELSARS